MPPARTYPPEFPERWYSIADFGAVGDGETDCTETIRSAIATCHRAGGGHVFVPEGSFRTSAIHLFDNVDLHLGVRSTLLFTADPAKYLPPVLTRWQGIELYNYSPLIYAYDRTNVAVSGDGILDGGASVENWWPWSGQAEYGWCPGMPQQDDEWPALTAMADAGTPVADRVFGKGSHFRPSFIEFYRCRNVLVSDVTIVRSPAWIVHPTLCNNVTVRNITVDSLGPNNDGCDPESCRDVLIEGCTIAAGDDAIAIKSGRESDGRRIGVPCQNIIIRDCDLRSKYGAITIGSEMTGGVRDVVVSDCRLGDDLYFALYIKTNSVRGGSAENIRLHSITVGRLAKEFFTCDFFRGEGDVGLETPVVRGIDLADITVAAARRALLLRGYARSPISNVRLQNCFFDNVSEPDVIEHVDGLYWRDNA